MRNFNQGGGGHFGSGNRGGGSRFGGGRPSDRGPVTMHQAICSKCGKECEVPFRPTGDKPIYCNDCFAANRGSTGSPRGERGGGRPNDRFPRRDFTRQGGDDVKKQLEFLGLKIDRLTKVVEGLAGNKTSFSKEKSTEVKEALKGLAISEEVKTKTPAKKATKKIAKKTTKKTKA